ncbi:MAG: MFS transporter [Candidatus Eremiobacteraeota bacterium]|nr:MFS transporter [Candidatus Eremiobacteraeota bacterium]MBC5822620.1 MFS transporter [Candidatus Eremiobacteraeota bacterium]
MLGTLLPILGITFIDILGFSILLPILPYYVKHFGASTVAVGALFSTFALCQFVAGPVWGAVSDRIGRKTVLIVSQIGATVGWAGLAFAPSLPWVFAARIVEGLSGGNISVTQAYVADRVEPEQRSRAFAYVGAAFSAGIVLGPVAGGVLLAHFGYAAPFLLAAGLQVVTLLATIFFLPEKVAQHGESERAATLGDIARFLGDARVSPVLVQKFAYSLGLYAWFAVYALVLGAVAGFGPTQVSFFFAGFGLMSIAFQLAVVGRLVDRFGARASSNAGFAAAVLFFLLVPFLHVPLALFASQALFAFALAVTNATLAALLTDASPEHVRGTILGVGSSLDSASGIIMPTISTAVLAAFGPPWTGGISAFFCFIALALGIAKARQHAFVPPA